MLKASSGVIFLSAMAFSVAVSANASESYMSIGGEYFNWEENVDYKDDTFVSEYGPKIVYERGENNWWTKTQGRLDSSHMKVKLGYVSYHGGSKKYGLENIKGDTYYYDLEYFKGLGYRQEVSESFAIDYKGYIGVKNWYRWIDAGTHDSPVTGESEDIGAYEIYLGAFSKAGIGFKIKESLYLEAGVNYPVFVAEYSNSEENDDLIYPEADIGYYADITYRVNNSIFVKAYYEESNFKRSDNNDSNFYQPKSESSVSGISVGKWF